MERALTLYGSECLAFLSRLALCQDPEGSGAIVTRKLRQHSPFPTWVSKFRPFLPAPGDPTTHAFTPHPAPFPTEHAPEPRLFAPPPPPPGSPSLAQPFLSFQGPALFLPRDSSPQSHLRRPQLPHTRTPASPGFCFNSVPVPLAFPGTGPGRGWCLVWSFPLPAPITGPRPSWAALLSRLEASDLRPQALEFRGRTLTEGL